MRNNIKIPGHSGSKILIDYDKQNNVFIKKISSDKRLIRQSKKQKIFINRSDHINITASEIIKECFINKHNEYEFHMKYIEGLDMIEYFRLASLKDLEMFTKNLFRYFNKIIVNSKIYKNANKDISNKIDSVYYALLDNELIKKSNKEKFLVNIIDELIKELRSKDIILPVGDCHGDLTLSNMIYNTHSKKIILFDFLDTYFESPVQDMIKIKQDLTFNWTFQKFSNKEEVDKNRLKIIRNYLDVKFENYFKSFEFYNENYNVLQILNLLRVLVYTKDCTTIDYLIKCIEDLHERQNNVNYTSSWTVF
jgi:hypothetical protein